MSKNYCTLYIARHGETEFNVQKILQGHCDSPLTLKGLGQAENLAEGLKSVNFDMIYSSDLLRAKRTAEIVKLERDLAIITTKVLRERFYGDYDGRPNQDYVAARDKLVAELKIFTEADKRSLKVDPKAESVDELMLRFITFLREIAVANLNKKILIVTHGGVMRNFLIHLAWAKDEELPPYSLNNCCYIVLESDGVDFFVKKAVGINKKTL